MKKKLLVLTAVSILGLTLTGCNDVLNQVFNPPVQEEQKGDEKEQTPAGKLILNIEKTGTEGLVDTYTITFTDGSTLTFTITNGAAGEAGQPGAAGADGDDGAAGKSAYELACENGYTGTVEEWLLSLVGADGAKGEDGKDGADGDDGAAGKSAYELACEKGYTGTLDEWLLSLVGAKGADGADGAKGEDGKDGAAGKSAYDLACENGYKGTLEEWLLSLVGADGAKGEDGKNGEKGDTAWSNTILAAEHGYVTVDMGSAVVGEMVTFTVVADQNYFCDKLYLNGVDHAAELSENNSVTVPMVEHGYVVRAHFKLIVYVDSITALDAALDVDDNYIVLTQDLTYKGTPGATGKNVVLNMDGHTLESQNYGGISAQGADAALTIMGNGHIKAVEYGAMAFDGATVIINDGTYEVSDNFVLGTNGSTGRGKNTIIVNGGTFNGGIVTAGYIACGVYVANDDSVFINAGTFNINGGVGILARSGNTLIGEDVVLNLTEVEGRESGWVGDNKNKVPAKPIVVDTVSNYPGGLPEITNNTEYPVFTMSHITGIELSEEAIDTYVGAEDVTVNATINPDPYYLDSITWTSSNETVATVSEGKISFVGAGDAVITAANAAGDVSDTVNVHVGAIHTVAEGSLLEDGELDHAYYMEAFVDYRNAAGTNITLKDAYGASVQFSLYRALRADGVSLDDIVVGSKLFVVGTKVGTYNNSKQFTQEASTILSVTNDEIYHLELSADKTALQPGDTANLTPSVLPTSIDLSVVTYASDDSNVVTVEDGVVTAVGDGEANVTATLGNANASVKFAVSSATQTLADVTVGIKSTAFTATSTKIAEYTEGNVTITLNQNTSSTANRLSDGDHLRVYKNAKLSVAVSGAKIKKAEFTCTSPSYAAAANFTVVDGAVSTSGSVTTIELTTAADVLEFVAANQTRINSVKIYYVPVFRV